MSRFALRAAVVGALLVGGVATGGTGATWTGQRDLAGAAVSSGTLSFTASQPADVSVAKTAGAEATTSFVLDDTSTGKNLDQRVTVSVTSTPTGVTATVGTSCPGGSSVQVDSTPTTPDASLCVRVVSSTTAVSGSVVLSASGAQRPSGWTTAISTISVPVTVTAAVPAAPVISCTGNNQGVSWTAVSGATSYVVSTSPTLNGTYTDRAPQTGTTFTPALSNNTSIYVRVRSRNADGDSANSSVFRIVRSGGYTCGAG